DPGSTPRGGMLVPPRRVPDRARRHPRETPGVSTQQAPGTATRWSVAPMPRRRSATMQTAHPSPTAAPPPADVETPDERLNRNLDQLLQELRVALPGVQVLFAFLLVVPFNARFDEVTSRERLLYV